MPQTFFFMERDPLKRLHTERDTIAVYFFSFDICFRISFDLIIILDDLVEYIREIYAADLINEFLFWGFIGFFLCYRGFLRIFYLRYLNSEFSN